MKSSSGNGSSRAMYLKLSKTVLSVDSSKRHLSLASLRLAEQDDDDNKENIPPYTPSPSGSVASLVRRPHSSFLPQSKRSVTGPLRSNSNAAAVGGQSPPSVLKKAMRAVSKSALEKAYAVIHAGHGEEKGEGGSPLVPIDAEPPKIELFGLPEEVEEGGFAGIIASEAPKIEVSGLGGVGDIGGFGGFGFDELQHWEIEAAMGKQQELKEKKNEDPVDIAHTTTPKLRPASRASPFDDPAVSPFDDPVGDVSDGDDKDNENDQLNDTIVPAKSPGGYRTTPMVSLGTSPDEVKQTVAEPTSVIQDSPADSITLSRSKTLPPRLAKLKADHQLAAATPTPMPKGASTTKYTAGLRRASTVHFTSPVPVPAPAPRPNGKQEQPPAPGALRAALLSVSESSVKSAYAALQRGQSFDDTQLRQNHHDEKKDGNGLGNLNRVATIAARRAFSKRPVYVRHKTKRPREKKNNKERDSKQFTGNVLGNATSNNNSAVWWSHPSSFASTPAPSILDFSPDRSNMGRGKRIKRFFRKVVERLRRHKDERKKLERRPSSRRSSQITVNTVKSEKKGGGGGEGQGFIGDRGRRAMRDRE